MFRPRCTVSVAFQDMSDWGNWGTLPMPSLYGKRIERSRWFRCGTSSTSAMLVRATSTPGAAAPSLSDRPTAHAHQR